MNTPRPDETRSGGLLGGLGVPGHIEEFAHRVHEARRGRPSRRGRVDNLGEIQLAGVVVAAQRTNDLTAEHVGDLAERIETFDIDIDVLGFDAQDWTRPFLIGFAGAVSRNGAQAYWLAEGEITHEGSSSKLLRAGLLHVNNPTASAQASMRDLAPR
mgnify:CR=1 FL=1